MAENSGIEWTTHTFNPWRGCTKVSAGCANCYADNLSKRNPGTLGVWGPGGTRVVAAEAQWREPLRWDRLAKEAGERHRVFCASLADVFEDWRGPMVNAAGQKTLVTLGGKPATGPNDDYPKPLTMQDVRKRLFDLTDATPHLDWLLLTKRPENLSRMLPHEWRQTTCPPNVWLGTSVEDQESADERIPHLLRAPAAVRFLSCEPLLGPVDLDMPRCETHDRDEVATSEDGEEFCDECAADGFSGQLDHGCWLDPLNDGIGWVIVGGESGAGARPMQVEWVRSVVEQCRAAGVACFVKQMGDVPVMDEAQWRAGTTRLLSNANRHRAPAGTVPLAMARKGGDPQEWPEELQVREFPEVARG